MNTSRSRNKRKKAIPLYFQKSHTSLSDILHIASYKRRIKELLKNNKSLAVSLQDARYKAAKQQKDIEKYSRTTTQISHARLKLTDMLTTIQKLVTEVDEVRNFLDIDSFSLLKNSDSNEHRLRIQVPEESTIEESASRSSLEADLTSAEFSNDSVCRQINSDTSNPASKDNSVTEIYDHQTSLARVDSVLKANLAALQEDNNAENLTVGGSVSISIQSPLTPQLVLSKNKLPGRIEAFLQSYKELPREPLQVLNALPPLKNATNTFVSKIPRVLATQPFCKQDENKQPVQLPSNSAHRRDTFVVEKPCNVPNVFPTAADRRGTFTISNLSEDIKCQNDRRGTYLVPPQSVPTVPEEEPLPTHNIVESKLSSENALQNKTILLCEDMELTEIIPTHKLWNDEPVTAKEISSVKNEKAVTPLADEDVEFTEVIPVFKLPLTKDLLEKVVNKDSGTFKKSSSPKENVPKVPAIESPFDDACFAKPKSDNIPLSSSSNHIASLEQLQIQSSADKVNSEDGGIILPKRSLAKKKKSDELELADLDAKETMKERASSVSRRKSLAHRKSVRFSDVKPKGTHHKSLAKSSINKPLSPKHSEVNYFSDVDDESSSDISLSHSSSCSTRPTRSKSNIQYDKFFEDSFHSDPKQTDDKFVPGRKVFNFNETRKSLVPNKRTFVFTKKVAVETSIPANETNKNSQDAEAKIQDDYNDVFEFSASETESSGSNTNNKPKKAKKATKRSNPAAHSRGKKDSSNKRSRSENVPQQQMEKKINSEAANENQTHLPCTQKLSSTSKSDKRSTKSGSSEDSFVIGDKIDEIVKVKEMVNLKGDRVFSEISKHSLKSASRQCKKSSVVNLKNKASLSPEIDAPTAGKDDACEDVLSLSHPKLTSSHSDQVRKTRSSHNKSPPITDSTSIDACTASSSRSSKVSEGKRKAKRTFSGVSERKSKKKSTLDSPTFLEELDNAEFPQESLPQTAWLQDNVLSLDCDMTEVYNFKDMVKTKMQENNPIVQEQLSGDNRVQQDNLTEKPEILLITKTQDVLSDARTLALSSSEDKKVFKNSNKEKGTSVKRKVNEEISTKDTLPYTEARTSPSSNRKSKKIVKDCKQKQAIEEIKIKCVDPVVKNNAPNVITIDVLCNTEALASLNKNKYEKSLKDLNLEQISVAKDGKHKEIPTKKLSEQNVKTKDPLSCPQSPVPSTSNNSSPVSKDIAPIFDKAAFENMHLDDLANNDFKTPKSRKLHSAKKDRRSEVDGVKAKKVRPKSKPKSSLKKKSTSKKVPPAIEINQDPGSSKATQELDDVDPVVADSVPIHRQNCSGSIGSLCNVDSKDTESRPSRRTKAAKSYKEPKLNCKMRR